MIEDEPIILNAYLATALTGLIEDERTAIFFLSEVVSKICEKHYIKLYQPRKKTDPVNNPDIPDSQVYFIDRSAVANSDLLILYTAKPSFGAGMELEIAGAAMVPTILLIKEGLKPSRMVTGSITEKIKILFSDPDDLTEALDRVLTEIRPKLINRRLTLLEKDNIIGRKIAKLRQNRGMTRKYLAAQCGVDEAYIKALETQPEKITNPSIQQIRRIAYILDVSPSWLVEVGEPEDPSTIQRQQVIREFAYQYNIGYRDLVEFSTFATRSSKGDKPLTVKECFSLFQRMKKYKK